MSSSSGSADTLSPVEFAKRAAARRAVDAFVRDGHVVGVGSGTTIVYAVERISERVKAEKLTLICIPTLPGRGGEAKRGWGVRHFVKFPAPSLALLHALEIQGALSPIVVDRVSTQCSCYAA
jgi:hypothetical protein